MKPRRTPKARTPIPWKPPGSGLPTPGPGLAPGSGGGLEGSLTPGTMVPGGFARPRSRDQVLGVRRGRLFSQVRKRVWEGEPLPRGWGAAPPWGGISSGGRPPPGDGLPGATMMLADPPRPLPARGPLRRGWRASGPSAPLYRPSPLLMG
ncbi:hypothetical protein HRbin02_01352 [Candidatus Calditenuaceae archaeon HR02]|nr:hypothetical protein HRbin02_01352 [Candidatus Calditenuaceae archaeon HR02]